MKAGKINSLHRDMHFRKACPGDYEEIMAILASGRDAQRKFGFRQWGDDFPSGTMVSNDIITGSGYIMEIDGLTAGYAAIFVSDSEYEQLSHIWLKKRPLCSRPSGNHLRCLSRTRYGTDTDSADRKGGLRAWRQKHAFRHRSRQPAHAAEPGKKPL